MSKREPGQFRGKVFGGFNRKDVLAYITSVYEELEHSQAENDMLRERYEEAEELLNNRGIPHTPLSGQPPMAPMPEEGFAFQPALPNEQEMPSGLYENVLTAPEDLPMAAPVVREPIPAVEPVPVQPVYEVPRVVKKPALANPYPERGIKVKVRPAKES
jgi:hypothetical protein